MKSLKYRTTHLKQKVSDAFPSEGEILKFPGITKKLIVDCLDDTYNTLNLLDEFRDSFEVILLKRRISNGIDNANKYLKEKVEDQSPEEFNEFLYEIANIRYAANETYILLTKEPIRLDAELIAARQSLNEVKEQLQTISPKLGEAIKSYEEITAIVKSLKESQQESIKNSSTISDALNKISLNKKNAEKHLASIQTIEESISRAKSDLITKNETAVSLIGKLEVALKEEAKSKDNFDKLLNDLQSSIIENSKHQKEIQNTIEDSSRMGMAGSFKKRKDELSRPYWFWAIATILTIIGLIAGSSFIIVRAINSNTLDVSFLLLRLPIFASFVWLGWFCAKQYGFTSRIREDYSYKYAVSMAFEGYKKEAIQANTELLEHLLALTIYNISSNPINLFDSKSNHGTPLNELIDGLHKVIKKDNSQNKKVNGIAVNEVPVSDEEE